ncbi:MAG: polysaccharide biosynthesis/export family protein [Gemmatimonadaceae bacterium]
MPTPPRFVSALALVALSLFSPLQAQSNDAERRAFATRPELEAAAEEAERQSRDRQVDEQTRERKRLEGEGLRERLRDGDFQVGDRVLLRVRGDSSLTDTFTVRAGRALQLPNLDELSLVGVLRSELQSVLTRHIGRYVRDPQIETASLMRVAVVGSVNRPGFLPVTPSSLLADVIMLAGGPTGDADLSATVIRRGTREVWTKKDVRIAMSQGMTLDQLNLRAGDEIIVGQRRRGGLGSTVQMFVALGGALVAIVGLTR